MNPGTQVAIPGGIVGTLVSNNADGTSTIDFPVSGKREVPSLSLVPAPCEIEEAPKPHFPPTPAAEEAQAVGETNDLLAVMAQVLEEDEGPEEIPLMSKAFKRKLQTSTLDLESELPNYPKPDYPEAETEPEIGRKDPWVDFDSGEEPGEA